MRELRLALIIDTLDGQDASSVQLSLLARGLNRSRFAASVYVLGRADVEAAERLRREGLAVHVLDRTHGHDLRVLHRLKELLGVARTDMVCTWTAGGALAGRLAALWADVPVVVAVEQETERQTFGQLRVDGLLNRWTAAVVADNEASAARARRSRRDQGGVRLIRPGIEALRSGASPAAAGLPLPEAPAGWRVAVTACPLVRSMGLLHLIWALSILRYADQPLQLWIAGEGFERSRLAEEASRLDVGARVHFLGRRNDMASMLRRADLFVLPCRQGRTNPAALEAMAMGVPAVLPDVEGMRHLADGGRCARLVEPGYPKSIAAGMFQAVLHGEQSRQMAERAKGHIREHYAAERFVGEYENLFVELAEARGLC
jgi:glycosyltransferase involved in cell wall biosynthesis